MTPKTIIVQGKTVQIPKLTVQQIIELSSESFEISRANLLSDLEESGASSSEKLAALSEFRREQDLNSVLIRSAFTPKGSVRIIERAFGSFPEELDILDPSELTNAALSCLGMDVIGESKSAEGKG